MQSPDSTPIDQVLAALEAQPAAQAPAPPAGPAIMTQKEYVGGVPTGPVAMATAKMAKNLLLYFAMFVVVLAVSTPTFQTLVMSFVPAAVTANGTLSLTGAFFKALFATAALAVFQVFFIAN
jgi:hypothetical protein